MCISPTHSLTHSLTLTNTQSCGGGVGISPMTSTRSSATPPSFSVCRSASKSSSGNATVTMAQNRPMAAASSSTLRLQRQQCNTGLAGHEEIALLFAKTSHANKESGRETERETERDRERERDRETERQRQKERLVPPSPTSPHTHTNKQT